MSIKSTGSAAARRTSRAAVLSPISRRMGAFVPLLLSAALLMLGLPRLAGTAATLSSQPQIQALQAGREVSDLELSRLDRTWSVAHRFSPSGEISAQLAAIKLEEAGRLSERAATERRALIADATALLQESLAGSPANSFAWARLAHALALAQEGGSEAVAAWRMSVLTAPADRRLLLWRSRFALARTAQLAQEDRELLDAQIRMAWRYDRKAFLNFARASEPDAVNLLRAALLDEPREAARFDQALR
jgi:hypothetical protein